MQSSPKERHLGVKNASRKGSATLLLAAAAAAFCLPQQAHGFLLRVPPPPGTSPRRTPSVRLRAEGVGTPRGGVPRMCRNLSEERADGGGLGKLGEDDGRVKELRLDEIKRPLGKTRTNDAEKVARLAESISDIGLQVPIDVLEVDGQYYGFSGCHRYEAHEKLGLETIKCRVIKASLEVLHNHMR
ncbi:unnamed protein product [Discosporangium mesarthrocarpum]